ncbi:MAG: hypothetical protein WCJ14_15055 [Verrucomicrobiota bacterium]
MSSDLSSMESALRQLRPARPDAALLARLEACTDNSWTEPQPATRGLVNQLGRLAPSPLPAALLAALTATLDTVAPPGEPKIISFPSARTATPHHPRRWWGAAAAVALIGGVAALYAPIHHATGPLAAAPHAPNQATLPTRPTGPLIPASFNRGLTEAHDEGVIWPSNDQARRVLKVVYRDRVTLKDASGRTYQVDRPRVEYILVPANAD